jgi:hypothetical protein
MDKNKSLGSDSSKSSKEGEVDADARAAISKPGATGDTIDSFGIKQRQQGFSFGAEKQPLGGI